ncbi:hypothetical protein DFH09DRAFT_465031 [Mycena vulgaris]|nr:hypothetical protein DFH09DRAFT_465031 [Mycena vulgaris]
MDGNLSQQAVKRARKYTKQPPALEIPSPESIRARGSGSSSTSPTVLFSSSASTQVSLRAQKRSQWCKMDDVLRTYGLTVSESCSLRHRQAVGAFLRGRCATTMADIIPLIFNHKSSAIAYTNESASSHAKNRSDPQSRRHLRATSDGRTENADVVDWEDVKFSIEELAGLNKKEEPFLWYMTECLGLGYEAGCCDRHHHFAPRPVPSRARPRLRRGPC